MRFKFANPQAVVHCLLNVLFPHVFYPIYTFFSSLASKCCANDLKVMNGAKAAEASDKNYHRVHPLHLLLVERIDLAHASRSILSP